MDTGIYHVKSFPAGTAAESIDWTAVPAAEVSHYRWYEGYTPAVSAKLVFVADFGFVLHMECAESNPKADYHSYMDPVYTDSCMEFFADWTGDGRYINLEMNACGALLSCVGADRHARTPIRDICGSIFPVAAEVKAASWSVTALIPLSMLAAILGRPVKITAGYTFRANFYKCGDDTAIPHYGMWNPVGTEKPDFHRPEYFGTLIVD